MNSRFVSSFFAASLVFLLGGCGATDSGNPKYSESSAVPPAPASPQAEAPSSGSSSLLSALCSKITLCSPTLQLAKCSAGIQASSSIDTEIGLSADFGTYQSVQTAESAGTLVANSAALASCIKDIEALSCSQSQVQAAYNSADPENFSNVVGMIPPGDTSCGGVFKK